MKIITGVEIKNFRSIKSLYLSELTDLTSFAGENDSGKSNVLKALNLFFNGETAFDEKFNFLNDYFKGALLAAREASKARQFISIKIFIDPREIRGNDQLKKLAIQQGELWVEKKWKRDSDYPDVIYPKYLEEKPKLKKSLTQLFNQVHFVYIPAFKNQDVFSYVLRLAGDSANVIISSSSRSSLNAEIDKATQELSQDFANISKIDTKLTLPTQLGAFWSSLEMNTAFQPAEAKAGVFKRGGIDDYYIRMDHHGEGIKSLFIPVALHWLAKNITNKYWIWGIDEPENSLEMVKVSNLFDQFLNVYAKKSQIFCSTHSPIFIFPAQKGSGVYLASVDDEYSTSFDEIDDSHAENVKEKMGGTYQEFLDIQQRYAADLQKLEEIEKENTRLNFQIAAVSSYNKILLVEGESDQIILNAAWEKLYPGQPMPFFIQNAFCASALQNALSSENLFKKNAGKKFIGLFDFDDAYSQWNGVKLSAPAGNSYRQIVSSEADGLLKKHSHYLGWCMLLPVPPHRAGVASAQLKNLSCLSIEMLFDDAILSVGNNLGSKVYPSGAVNVFQGDKIRFANSVKNLQATDFDAFKTLFNAIVAI